MRVVSLKTMTNMTTKNISNTDFSSVDLFFNILRMGIPKSLREIYSDFGSAHLSLKPYRYIFVKKKWYKSRVYTTSVGSAVASCNFCFFGFSAGFRRAKPWWSYAPNAFVMSPATASGEPREFLEAGNSKRPGRVVVVAVVVDTVLVYLKKNWG